jgi:HSP20 family molecular chaperone IbpA
MVEETTLPIQESEKQEVEQGSAERTRMGVLFVPRSDIYETADAIHLICDMPGVGKDAADITLEQNILTISGHIEPREHEGQTLNYAEYRVGDYERRFTLSGEIDRDGIEAQLQDGVLRITLPKMHPAQHKIEVHSAA